MKKYFEDGSTYVWLTGAMASLSMLLVAGLFLLIFYYGFSTFWQSNVATIKLKDGSYISGEFKKEGKNYNDEDTIQLKIGNRDLYGLDFRWFTKKNIDSISYDKELLLVERNEWGVFYGFPKELQIGNESIIYQRDKDRFYQILEQKLKFKKTVVMKIEDLEHKISKINYNLKNLDLERKSSTLERKEEIENEVLLIEEKYQVLEKRLFEQADKLKNIKLRLYTSDGLEKTLTLENIERYLKPNSLSILGKIGLYFSKIWEFVSDEPRESNTEGGVFPAIFGTVLMVLIMSIVVLPLGVIAAVYLNEYAKPGKFLNLVRICVNNLAGVPSIVFGVFGLGFFIYGIGGTLDQLFFSDALPSPTFGTGGILWASLTLALLTVPVVIVATEEGLNAVPKGIRDGSLALGSTKWETLKNIIIPSAMPGILTGLILAIARATGEVAPLMITGVVKLAPSMPIDSFFPYLHFERKFMHLGFHIYDVGFQSPNSEAALPMVFSTTLLLILIVITLNLTAILLRNRLKKKYKGMI
tara:strand:+ start:3150 stop:4730 length:1581 start_codon:yes stop_codon:yes gene_type:complete